MKKLTDEELIARVEQYERNSYGIYDAALTNERKKAIDYYTGQPFGNEIEGRSQVVSRDVLDTIESALPQLLKPFVSGDEVVRFMPRGPEDEERAEQETAAVSYYVTEKNDFFAVSYAWFKDALLSKNGYVKVWWEEEDEVETETYQGLTDDQLTLLLQDERIEVVEHSAYPDERDAMQRQEALQQLSQSQDPQAQQQVQQIMAQPPAMLHDVKITITEKKGCIKIDNVAPEDILVGTDCRTVSVKNATFVQHRALMCKEEIEEQGWELPDNAPLSSDAQAWQEALSRDLYNESADNKDFEKYLVKDTYLLHEGERIRLVIIGNDIVHKETEDVIVPFATITPHIMPHRHVGMSYSDLTEDIQLIKSTLLRGQLDAMYLANSPRFGISNKVNLEDMLTSRPGGVVRVEGDPGGNIMPLLTPAFPPTSFQLVEYLDTAKERRTGITAYNQGLDANSLNKTATGVSQIMQATQQRIELVARTFANTGVKELFTLVHRLVRKYNTRPDVIRIRNDWATVDPREWKERKDMTIAVGLGTGNKDQQLMHLQAMWQRGMASLQAGLPTITPENMYEIERQLAINSGFKNPEQFVTDPKEVPPKPPQPDPQIQMKQMDLAADAQKFQAQTQIDRENAERDARLEAQKAAHQAEIDQRQAEQQWQQEQLRSQNDVQIEREKIKAQAELELFKAKLDAETKIAIEQIKAQNQPAGVTMVNDTTGGVGKSMEGFLAKSEESQRAMIEAIVGALSRPKKLVRGPDGRAIGVE